MKIAHGTGAAYAAICEVEQIKDQDVLAVYIKIDFWECCVSLRIRSGKVDVALATRRNITSDVQMTMHHHQPTDAPEFSQ